ncbi:glycerophosphodiester phosphodiesterase family protein [Compostibacter hankyongensis]|uniref:Glycerophosphodiester phosphodiesterase family protein n=1 Tax=Compostibacter hankyongensis TaxID=1007089 RepID=A0ABP8GAV2_9BACT
MKMNPTHRIIMPLAAALLAIALAAGCSTAKKTGRASAKAQSSVPNPDFYKVGHRGTRGLMPENTIPSFEKALEIGANTIECDVHITRDGKVMIYHDASPTPSYTTFADGSDIPPAERKKYTWYKLNYDEIRKFVIGMKDYPAFPQQQRIATYAPLMGEMIDSVEAFTRAHDLPEAFYLVEIKSGPGTDGVEQPNPEEYMKILMPVLNAKHLGNRLIVQSFDERPLQIIHRDYPNIRLGFLLSNKKTFEENLQTVGFTPEFYNPSFNLVTPELVKACHDKGIKIVPWTVDSEADVKKMKALGVDGIITDYPNYLQGL